MYFDYILESEDTVLTDKVIENATYEACLAYGEEFMDHVEDYINLLEDKDNEPTHEFDEFIFENLSPYLENESKYIMTFLEFDTENGPKLPRDPAQQQRKFDAEVAKRKAGASDGGSRSAPIRKNSAQANNSAKAVANRESSQRVNAKLGSTGQANLNKSRRDILTKKGNLAQSMKKGFQKAKMQLGGKVMTGAKRLTNKLGATSMLGKAASAVGSMGRKVAQSGGTGRRALNSKRV